MKYLRKAETARWWNAALALAAGLLTACGGGGGGSSPPPPPPLSPTVINMDVGLGAADVIDGSNETGSGSAEVSYNQTDGEIEISVALTGVSADAVTVHNAYAGAAGEERYALTQGATANEWSLPSSPIAGMDASALESGALYIQVTTAGNPSGALRGQILPPGIGLERITLAADQVPAGSVSGGSGMAWATTNTGDNLITVHLLTAGISDASSAEVREGLAGLTGPVVLTLVQDAADADHWLLEEAAYTADIAAAGEAGELYINVATAGMPGGAIRGQALPGSMELVITDLESDSVVMSVAAKSRALTGRAMTTIADAAVTSHVNLYGAASANAVELRQAPAGQNGPVLLDYQQDGSDPALWRLEDVQRNATLDAALASQALYVSVATATAPEGIARGQVVTDESEVPADETAFVVLSIDPPNAAEVTALPSRVDIVLNREPLATSVQPQAVSVEGSGGDGEFASGNEVSIVPASVTASGNVIEIDLAGVQADDDVYRVSVTGGGEAGVVDLAGIPLDGDGDGEPGGVFESAFEVTTPEVTATLSQIQETIFTPSCATSGCHRGANPPDGLNLSDGQSFSNIVNVGSVQRPSMLRIEPGNPDDSYLVRKIQGTGIMGSRMPLGSSPLSQSEIDLVVAWVTDGAPDN